MTDIVERLRHEATSKEIGILEQGSHASDRYRLLMEAADEIERLTAQLCEATQEAKGHLVAWDIAVIDRARAAMEPKP